MSYYNKLEWYAARMIRAPDHLTFKTQLMTGLPDEILLHVLQKGCMAEKSLTDVILYYARQAEDWLKLHKHYKVRRHFITLGSNRGEASHSRPPQHSSTSDRAPQRDDRSRYHDKY